AVMMHSAEPPALMLPPASLNGAHQPGRWGRRPNRVSQRPNQYLWLKAAIAGLRRGKQEPNIRMASRFGAHNRTTLAVSRHMVSQPTNLDLDWCAARFPCN